MTSVLGSTYRETPLWREDANLPGPFVDEPLPERVEFVVVGSGFTGAAAARELARRGRSVIVLEKESIGFGASTRTGGMVHPGVKKNMRELAAKYGEQAKTIYRVTIDAYDFMEQVIEEEGIDCHYARSGYIYLADTPVRLGRLRVEHSLLKEVLGERVQLLPQDELSEEIGSTEYVGGVFLEQGGRLQPAMYLAGLIRSALKGDARFFEYTPALAIERDSPGRFSVRTPRGMIQCNDVLVATDGYTDSLVPKLKRRIIPIGSYVIATEPLSEDVIRSLTPRGRVFVEVTNFLHYWRVSPDNRLVFGGRVSFAPTTIARARDANYKKMLRVYPQLEGTRVEYAWSGQVGFALDRLPHAGRMDGVAFAMGYSGAGIVMSTYFGMRMGGWLSGAGPPPVFPEIRFPLVPMYTGKPWFLPLVGPWYQLRDKLR